MKRISLYPNAKRDPDFRYTREAIRLLSEAGAEILVRRDCFSPLSDFSDRVEFVTEEELFSRGECLIPFGGDGTILSVAKRAAEAKIPICGFNLGHVGFLTAAEKGEIGLLPRLLTGKYRISQRMMLTCRINGEEALCALNECVIVPERGVHILELSVACGRRKLCNVRADGLIFHTPTGSTGYAFSAGGAVIDGGLDTIGVKTVSSYLLRGAQHMIFSPDTVFTVRDCRSECPVTVCADGRETRVLAPGDVLQFSRSEKRVSLISFSDRTTHEIFFRKS